MARKLNYDEEIKYCDKKISEYKAKRDKLRQLKEQRENERIITLVRESKISIDDLTEVINVYAPSTGATKDDKKGENDDEKPN